MAKVLLVEDDNNLREIYEARLQAEGYTVLSSHDGEEALVVAKNELPDLIISDVMMPKISGFEMLDILRNTDGLKKVKVIMLTALGQNEDQTKANSLGADKYLVKSQVTLEDIVKSVKELIGGNELTDHNMENNSVNTANEPETEPVSSSVPLVQSDTAISADDNSSSNSQDNLPENNHELSEEQSDNQNNNDKLLDNAMDQINNSPESLEQEPVQQALNSDPQTELLSQQETSPHEEQQVEDKIENFLDQNDPTLSSNDSNPRDTSLEGNESIINQNSQESIPVNDSSDPANTNTSSEGPISPPPVLNVPSTGFNPSQTPPPGTEKTTDSNDPGNITL